MIELHVITWKRKWGVYKRNSERSMRNFKHSDLAFLFACSLNYPDDLKIVVHNEDGSVDFIHKVIK